MVSIQAIDVEGSTVLLLTGELDAVSSQELRHVVTALMDGRPHLVLELSGVERMYAAGMSALLDLQRAALRKGARLICCGARPFIREMLRITMLDRTLDLQADLQTAIDLAREAC